MYTKEQLVAQIDLAVRLFMATFDRRPTTVWLGHGNMDLFEKARQVGRFSIHGCMARDAGHDHPHMMTVGIEACPDAMVFASKECQEIYQQWKEEQKA